MTNTGGWPGSETNDGQTDRLTHVISVCVNHTHNCSGEKLDDWEQHPVKITKFVLISSSWD